MTAQVNLAPMMSRKLPVGLASGFLLLISSAAPSYGAGMTIHTMMGDASLKYLQESGVRDLIEDEHGAFQNGTFFPDTGYIGKDYKYGEFSHWSPFHNLYLKKIADQCETFPFRDSRCRKLFSHLLGTIAHSIGDMKFDRVFIPEAAKHDYGGDTTKADNDLSIALDFWAILTKGRAADVPRIWVPFDDLMPLYSDFPDKAALKKKMREKTRIHALAQVGERFGSLPGYLYLRYKHRAPWSYANIIEAPGGVEDTARLIAQVYDDIWRSLTKHGFAKLPILHHRRKAEGPGLYYWVEQPAAEAVEPAPSPSVEPPPLVEAPPAEVAPAPSPSPSPSPEPSPTETPPAQDDDSEYVLF
jgi:hypothetical protein